MGFRFDIGALRAFAVVVVFFYHFNVPFFNGGFIGVDVFFVISGYLMTQIILKGIEQRDFSYFQFVKKRAIRILPPLLFVGFFILLLSSLFFFSETLSKNAKYVAQSITFSSNIFYWLYHNYFDVGAQNNIFIHSWSLSVEWQFYLLYPLFLLLLRPFYFTKKSIFNFCFITVTLLSCLLCIVYTNFYNSFSFYMIPTRGWEMLLGGLAFLYTDRVRLIFKGFILPAVSISILVLILTVILLDESYIWPSVYTLVPTIATFLIISLNSQSVVFRNRFLQYIGNISYSLYLWHWPLFVIFKYFALTETIWILVPMLLSVLFAAFTYHTVEKSKTYLSMRVISIGFPVIFILSIILYKYPNNLFLSKIRLFNPSFQSYFEYDQFRQFNSCNCFLTRGSNYDIYDKEKCLSLDTTKINVLLIGDSHSAQFSQSFRSQLSNGYNLLEISAGFSFPFLNARGDESSVKLLSYFYNNFLPQNFKHIDQVFISVHWLMRTSEKMNYSKDEIKIELVKLMNLFDNYNIDYQIIGQTETYTMAYPKIIFGSYLSSQIYPKKYIKTDAFEMNNFLKTIIPQNRYIDVYNLKSIVKNDPINHQTYMFDDNHLSQFGADQYVKYLFDQGYFKAVN